MITALLRSTTVFFSALVFEWGLSAPLELPPSVFHGLMACALDGWQAGEKKGLTGAHFFS